MRMPSGESVVTGGTGRLDAVWLLCCHKLTPPEWSCKRREKDDPPMTCDLCSATYARYARVRIRNKEEL